MVSATRAGAPLGGKAYVELTGYAPAGPPARSAANGPEEGAVSGGSSISAESASVRDAASMAPRPATILSISCAAAA